MHMNIKQATKKACAPLLRPLVSHNRYSEIYQKAGISSKILKTLIEKKSNFLANLGITVETIFYQI